MSHEMKLGKSDKVLAGFATVWVAIYPVLFFFRLVEVFDSICLSAYCTPTPMRPLNGFSWFVFSPPGVCISGLLYFALIVFYVRHVRGNTTISVTARVIWGLGIIFLAPITMPVYFLLYIWLQGRRVESKTSEALLDTSETEKEVASAEEWECGSSRPAPAVGQVSAPTEEAT